ncbi:MAG: hypothetical protein V1755_06920 [Chloroflexota bacterium]
MEKRMTKQKQMLPAIVDTFTALDPACAILLVGSVQHGYERPGSDIDIIAIVHDTIQTDPAQWQVRWEHRGVKSLTGNEGGVELCVFFAPISAFERWLTETPHHMYPFSRGEILHDPEGLAGRYQAVARGYFEAHPAIAEEWEAQLQAHKQVKLTGRDENGCYRTAEGHLRKYLTLDAFAAHMSELAKREIDENKIQPGP